ncbi:DegT/DnrJ/EryC1/StrS family aminotransferase [Desulfosarcina ovata]|uniref:Glutamine--scyllo-inositol aminotransferase n=1 Tax=Desulfosarcina ovata subsp. ovata TaxID=2752305 RepID=A0A5K8AI17_9BACT|nr:DegT/DnrJ/EryC1/StrS family aminotransferase [Desulfosarcina ovata]BBO92116.1 glutamine--scyllo-inositol aminotransferase [Desulfosarcina ovata subsp. ovata]
MSQASSKYRYQGAPPIHSYIVPYMKFCYSQEMIEAVERYMKEGEKLSFYRRGEECELFEKEFADFCGKKYAVSSNSGTASLHLSLLAAGIESGDEVMLTPHVAPAVGNAVLCAGAKPVFVDIDEETWTMDPSKIEEKITSNTKAIIPVHTYGHPADMDPIMETARKYNLLVIEDGTHAIGSKYKGNRLPLGGDRNIGIFGLTAKQLFLLGQCAGNSGGMLVTDNKELAEKVRSHKNCHSGEVIGYSYLMDDISATVGRIQLRHLEEYVEMQRNSAKILNERLKETPVQTSVEKEWAYHTYARYAIRAPERDALQEFLRQKGVDCIPLYPTPTHMLKLYRNLVGNKRGDFPVTEKQKKEELSLPEPKFRSEWDLNYVARKIAEFYA